MTRFKFFAARLAGAAFLLTLGATWRLHRLGLRHELHLEKRGEKRIYAFWHGRLFPLAYSHRDRKIHIMISEHADGELIAQVTGQVGFGSVRGSTTRGGMRALRALSRKLVEGFDVAITPDGPRGPRHVLQSGAIYIAMRSGCPLVPITSSGWPRWTFGSWDRFIVPRPFARVVVLAGAPFYVPPDIDQHQREQYRLRFEKIMTCLVEQADHAARTGMAKTITSNRSNS